jgi:hypothetical protein
MHAFVKIVYRVIKEIFKCISYVSRERKCTPMDSIHSFTFRYSFEFLADELALGTL